MAPVNSTDSPPPQNRVARPAAHVGLGDNLPPIRTDDGNDFLRALASGGSSPNASSHEDILERLQALQLAAQSASPARNWGPVEKDAREMLEAAGNDPNNDEAAEDAMEALADVTAHAVDDDGFTLLHYASMYGNLDAIASLVKRKANLNARTKVHETPLQLAAYYRHAEACALLLTHRARSDLADWQGRRPVEAAKASRCGGGAHNNPQAQAQCIELLTKHLADAEATGAAREAEDLRKQGNAFFQKGQHKEAAAAYSVGLASWDDGLLYSNRAECYLKLGRHMEAKMDAQKAAGLLDDHNKRKALWRLGKACLALDELDRATEAVKEGLVLFQDDPALRQLKNDVELARRRHLGVSGT